MLNVVPFSGQRLDTLRTSEANKQERTTGWRKMQTISNAKTTIGHYKKTRQRSVPRSGTIQVKIDSSEKLKKPGRPNMNMKLITLTAITERSRISGKDSNGETTEPMNKNKERFLVKGTMLSAHSNIYRNEEQRQRHEYSSTEK
jgi:hypothetical protein